MWASLSLPWKCSFEQGWIAYCSGSIPIGAVVVDADGAILSHGRSMQHDALSSEVHHITNHPLSHAEVNALLGLDYGRIDPHTCILYAMVEPCPLCVGAIAMARIKSLKFAARDPYAGGTGLLSIDDYLIQKQIEVEGPQDRDFEDVITALQTTFFLRTQRQSADRVLRSWRTKLERGVTLGHRLQEARELDRLAKAKASPQEVLEYLCFELKNL